MASKHKKRCTIWLMIGKENQMHHDATMPRSQDYGKEKIPKGLSQQNNDVSH